MSSANALLNRLRESHGWVRWDCKALARVHAWAGHIARFLTYSPLRWAFCSLNCKGVQYLRRLEAITGTQCHPHRSRVWRWQQQFTRWYGDCWMNALQDQEAWAYTCILWLRGRQNWQKRYMLMLLLIFHCSGPREAGLLMWIQSQSPFVHTGCFYIMHFVFGVGRLYQSCMCFVCLCVFVVVVVVCCVLCGV